MGHDDHELAGPRGLGHQRMAHFQQVGDVREVLARHDFEIRHAPSLHAAESGGAKLFLAALRGLI